MRIFRTLLAVITALLLTSTLRAEEPGFNLIVVGDPQPQTEEQFAQLEELLYHISFIAGQYEDNGLPTAILLTGDVVWDRLDFLPRVKALFESLGLPVYAVIGNHDHNRLVANNERLAESRFEQVFGPRYYRFSLGNTEFFALDNIDYRTYDDYRNRVDGKQLRWLRREARSIADGKRIAIAMHAPAVDFRNDKKPHSYTKKIMRIFDGHPLHFITGHRHRHATVEIKEGVIEHNVSQVNGNLWFAPICSDGMPRSVFCIEESNDEWQWHYYVLLGDSTELKMVVWDEGEAYGHEEDIIVKVIGWDDRWRVEWAENGKNMGLMEQIEICDPDYMRYVEEEADYNDNIMTRLRRSAAPHSHYFRCRRTEPNSQITITATDRFGRVFTTGR